MNKHGPPAIDGQPQVVKAFYGACSAIPDQSGPHFALQVDWRFAHCHGVTVHWQLHALDNFGHMSLISEVPDQFALVGGQSASMGSHILVGDTINTFL